VGPGAPLLEVTAARLIPLGVIAVSLSSTLAYAQPPLPAQPPPFPDPTGRSGEPPPLLQELPRRPPPLPILPPLPPLPEREVLPSLRVFVREIRVVGNTVLPPEEIAAVVAPYVNRELTAEDLEALRVALTLLYVNRGYINSGAILPDQTVAEGTVTYQVIEGRVTQIDVEGNRWFRTGYLRSRLALGAGVPLDVNKLQEKLQLLLEDPRIRRLNADLKPGLQAGEATLTATVEERLPYKVWFTIDNYQTPAVGAERGIAALEHQNLTGWGDVLTFKYGRGDGLDPLIDVRYAAPVTPYDTTVSFQYRKNDFTVITEEFRDLHIKSDSEIFTLGVRQPVYRTPTTEVALELIGERLSLNTTLLGEPFDLTPGSRKGESVVTAIRTVQEVVHRTQNQVIALRSRMSWGTDWLGATAYNGPEPDSHFFAWLGQFQAVRQFEPLGIQAIFRADLQFAHEPLLILEQMAVGGRYTVRGYRENTFVRDNGFVTSMEVRVPLVRNRSWADYLQLAPFVDYGRAWATKPPVDKPLDIPSIGIGLRWGVTIPALIDIRPQLEVYWGYPLRDIKTSGGDIQDKGVHFQFVLGFF
jgi:hemolysin activation/secretion protein